MTLASRIFPSTPIPLPSVQLHYIVLAGECAFRKALLETAVSGDSEMFFHLLNHCGRTFDSESSPLDSEFLKKAVMGGFDSHMPRKLLGARSTTDLSSGLLDILHRDDRVEMSRWMIDHGADPFIVVQPSKADDKIPLRVTNIATSVLLLFLSKINEQLSERHPEKRSATSQALPLRCDLQCLSQRQCLSNVYGDSSRLRNSSKGIRRHSLAH